MAKYTTQFKQEVVEQYLAGEEGYKRIASRHGLNYGIVKRWVRLYQTHGSAGLEKKSGHYSAERKLSILRHMWDNQLSYGQTAALFNIRSQGSISTWERRYHDGGLVALVSRPAGASRSPPGTAPSRAGPTADVSPAGADQS